jgi:hypothetical protein
MKNKELFDLYLTDSLNTDEEKELLEKLETDKVSDSFIEHIFDTNMMVTAAENLSDYPAAPVVKKKTPLTFIFLAAACLIVGFFLKPTTPTVKFKVAESNNPNFIIGTTISPDIFKLKKGLITLHMSSGNIVTLKAPVTMKVHSHDHFELSNGSLNLRLADHVKNFIIDTPHGSVRDLGTAFGLKTNKENTLLNVYEGLVEVTSLQNKMSYREGEAVSFNQEGELKRAPYNNNILEDIAEIFYLGKRQILPGEEVTLILDKAAEEINSEIEMSFEKNDDFTYKIIAISNNTTIFESPIYSATQKYKISIPLQNTQELQLKMKVVKGSVINGFLKLNKLQLQTKGSRPYEGELLIPANSEWSYLFNQLPQKNWRTNTADTTHWLKGFATLGYGDHDLRTKIGSNDLKNTVKQIYFRKEVLLDDLELNSLTQLTFNLLADDGAVVYLNGREVIRYNLPTGTLTKDSGAKLRANSRGSEMIYQNFSVPADYLVMGKNIISVILYQIDKKSSDMRFDLQMKVY